MKPTAYEIVKTARDSSRPTGGDFIRGICREFTELHGDRRFGDDPAVVGGLAWLGSEPVTVIAVEKGHSARERAARNSGAPSPEGYRKALRLAKQAEKFHRSVLLFVDTAGAYCGSDAEERGQGEAIAENLRVFSTLQVPVISIIIGEGGSGGALALAVADRVWMLENAVYSVISPEGCASILWKDASKASEAAKSLCLTAEHARMLGVIEEIIPERELGSDAFYADLREKLVREFALLRQIPDRTEARYRRFRAIGAEWNEDEEAADEF